MTGDVTLSKYKATDKIKKFLFLQKMFIIIDSDKIMNRFKNLTNLYVN